MVFYPLVSFGRCPGVVVDVLVAVYGQLYAVVIGVIGPGVLAEEGVRGSELQGGRELRTRTGIDLLVRGVTGQRNCITQVMGNTVVERKVGVGPVGKLLGLPA